MSKKKSETRESHWLLFSCNSIFISNAEASKTDCFLNMLKCNVKMLRSVEDFVFYDAISKDAVASSVLLEF